MVRRYSLSMHPYRTLGATSEIETAKIKGSRFLAYAAPVRTDDDVSEHLAGVQKLHHAARHVCWARVLGRDGDDTRARDAGEPSGSAGKPILAAIQGRELTFVCVAVVRYFGGTKLGIGGLARAYGGAAAEALDSGTVVDVVPSFEVRAQVQYPLLDGVRAFAAREARSEADAQYGAVVALRWVVPASAARGFADRLFDATGGKVRPEIGDTLVEVGDPVP